MEVLYYYTENESTAVLRYNKVYSTKIFIFPAGGEWIIIFNSNKFIYCRIDWKGTGASRPRGGRARDFVNFRGKIRASRARRGRAGLKGPRPDLTMTGPFRSYL
jgi:hypothetical protein